MLIEADHALFGYRGRAVVRADELRIGAGRCMGIFGPNGAGKTTLARGLLGLIKPLHGQLRQRQGLRIGYVAQHRAMELHWPMSGLDAAALCLSAQRRLGWIGAARAVRRSMQELGVAGLAHRPFGSLSGGQQQRLVLAGALANEPELLVLDEPTDGLDRRSRSEFLELLGGRAGRGIAVLIISHEVEDLLALDADVAWLQPAEREDEPASIELLPARELGRRLLSTGGRPC
jgi:zinc transport system ATP-binding protein